MIDIRKLKELVRLMVENDLTELDIRDEQETVTVKRPGIHVAPQVVAAPMMAAPAISVPAGFTRDGLPVGLQIVGRPRDDLSVLQLSHAFELAAPHGSRRPSLTPSAAP